MSDFTEAEYAAAIPACCSQSTLQMHLDMLLCWGLAASLREGKPMDCGGCELRKPSTKDAPASSRGEKE